MKIKLAVFICNNLTVLHCIFLTPLWAIFANKKVLQSIAHSHRASSTYKANPSNSGAKFLLSASSSTKNRWNNKKLIVLWQSVFGIIRSSFSSDPNLALYLNADPDREGRKSGLFVYFGQFPCTRIRICIPIRIQIHDSQINADPDPQHWFLKLG